MDPNKKNIIKPQFLSQRGSKRTNILPGQIISIDESINIKSEGNQQNLVHFENELKQGKNYNQIDITDFQKFTIIKEENLIPQNQERIIQKNQNNDVFRNNLTQKEQDIIDRSNLAFAKKIERFKIKKEKEKEELQQMKVTNMGNSEFNMRKTSLNIQNYKETNKNFYKQNQHKINQNQSLIQANKKNINNFNLGFQQQALMSHKAYTTRNTVYIYGQNQEQTNKSQRGINLQQQIEENVRNNIEKLDSLKKLNNLLINQNTEQNENEIEEDEHEHELQDLVRKGKTDKKYQKAIGTVYKKIEKNIKTEQKNKLNNNSGNKNNNNIDNIHFNNNNSQKFVNKSKNSLKIHSVQQQVQQKQLQQINNQSPEQELQPIISNSPEFSSLNKMEIKKFESQPYTQKQQQQQQQLSDCMEDLDQSYSLDDSFSNSNNSINNNYSSINKSRSGEFSPKSNQNSILKHLTNQNSQAGTPLIKIQSIEYKVDEEDEEEEQEKEQKFKDLDNDQKNQQINNNNILNNMKGSSNLSIQEDVEQFQKSNNAKKMFLEVNNKSSQKISDFIPSPGLMTLKSCKSTKSLQKSDNKNNNDLINNSEKKLDMINSQKLKRSSTNLIQDVEFSKSSRFKQKLKQRNSINDINMQSFQPKIGQGTNQIQLAKRNTLKIGDQFMNLSQNKLQLFTKKIMRLSSLSPLKRNNGSSIFGSDSNTISNFSSPLKSSPLKNQLNRNFKSMNSLVWNVQEFVSEKMEIFQNSQQESSPRKKVVQCEIGNLKECQKKIGEIFEGEENMGMKGLHLEISERIFEGGVVNYHKKGGNVQEQIVFKDILGEFLEENKISFNNYAKKIQWKPEILIQHMIQQEKKEIDKHMSLKQKNYQIFRIDDNNDLDQVKLVHAQLNQKENTNLLLLTRYIQNSNLKTTQANQKYEELKNLFAKIVRLQDIQNVLLMPIQVNKDLAYLQPGIGNLCEFAKLRQNNSNFLKWNSLEIRYLFFKIAKGISLLEQFGYGFNEIRAQNLIMIPKIQKYGIFCYDIKMMDVPVKLQNKDSCFNQRIQIYQLALLLIELVLGKNVRKEFSNEEIQTEGKQQMFLMTNTNQNKIQEKLQEIFQKVSFINDQEEDIFTKFLGVIVELLDEKSDVQQKLIKMKQKSQRKIMHKLFIQQFFKKPQIYIFYLLNLNIYQLIFVKNYQKIKRVY
ncbi:hypothetical protein PPERSA_02610 [Pseudocohnilembus persalinus]|uniref:Uncharacterized protein n=1 Tax=Pseudocohnilembus persalinus TaxID=266149 RepID=A0A0V0R5V7_PSEPJ|nr:hypothetical protein PPERSA_02610 [Pseudocohnilembus persalinus]|eukprot:KRX09738.1 hypothetical protein PPERSA_02610 [Pseudocohnilembus persalinus]